MGLAERISLLLPANTSCRFIDIVVPYSHPCLWRYQNPNSISTRLCLHLSSRSDAVIFPFARTKDRSVIWCHFSYGRGGSGGEEDEEDDGGSGGAWGKRMRTKRKQRWWSVLVEDVVNDGLSGILDQVVDNLLIFKVFKSFGYFLPFILLSFVTVSGPKAFLMTLAVTVGLSALILALEELIGIVIPTTKPRARRRRKPFRGNVATSGSDEEERVTKETRNRSWVGKDDDDGSARSSGGKESSFGGWDELPGVETYTEPSRVRSKPRREPASKGRKLGGSKRRRREKEPMLLRLLVALLPFLGYLTNMLW